EDGVLAGSMRRKERHHVAVVERETGGPEALRVGREVESSPDHASLQVGEAIPAIAVPLEKRLEIREEEDGRARHPSERLLETQIGRLPAKVTALQLLEAVLDGAIDVCPRLDSLHGVNGQVQIHQGWGHIRPPTPRGMPERRGQLLGADGLAR